MPMPTVPAHPSLAVVKQHDPNQCEEERVHVFYSQVTVYRGGKLDADFRQEPEAGAEAETVGKCCLLACQRSKGKQAKSNVFFLGAFLSGAPPESAT